MEFTLLKETRSSIVKTVLDVRTAIFEFRSLTSKFKFPVHKVKLWHLHKLPFTDLPHTKWRTSDTLQVRSSAMPRVCPLLINLSYNSTMHCADPAGTSEFDDADPVLAYWRMMNPEPDQCNDNDPY